MDEHEQMFGSVFEDLDPFLDERQRRLLAGAVSKSLGYGGDSAIHRATGLARATIRKGREELDQPTEAAAPDRVRETGGGRKRLTETDPELLEALDALVEPTSAGDPESPLRWTAKSLRTLAEELTRQDHPVSHTTVGHLLREAGYRLQANRKSIEGTSHPDRNEQFEHLNETANVFLEAGEPVISVDTKKKELVGEFKNNGREWRPSGEPEKVQVHDFPDPKLGKAIPYGVYDVDVDEGWVTVGTDHDTSTFAVESIRRWWEQMGRERYPQATRLLITADAGGSNGYRRRLWKLELQQLADELGLDITVAHYPPGTSKWNKIEHRLFSFISMNWRGRPLVSHEVVVELIAATTTEEGLRVESELDEGEYPTGVKVTDEQLEEVRLDPDAFHGEWNYTIHPREEDKVSSPKD